MIGNSFALPAFTGTQYFSPIGGLGLSSTEANVQIQAASAGTITNLYINLVAALGSGNTVVFTLDDAGSATTLTCTITGASQTTCDDITHTVVVAQGDLLSIKCVTTGSVSATENMLESALFTVINGGSNLAIKVETTTYTTTVLDYTIEAETGSGAFTVSLDSAPVTGEIHTIVLISGTNALTIDGNGNDINLNGSSQTSLVVTATGTSYTLQWDGSNWIII